MAYKTLQLRRDTAANWTSNNPTLLSGELVVETDTLKLKVGDGSTAWGGLSYVGDGGGGYTNLTSFVAQTAWRLFYSNADGDVTELALGTVGKALISGGASAAPEWGTDFGANTLKASKITLGAAGVATGSIEFAGTTSGVTTLAVDDIASNITFKLPTTDGGTLAYSLSGSYTAIDDFIDQAVKTTSRPTLESITFVGLATFLKSIYGNYGFIERNDGVSFYFLLTNSGDAYGSWNSLRPFIIDFATGNTQLSNILYVKHGTNVGVGVTAPNANAILDVVSTTKAFMPPRMTTAQRDLIASPTEGMVIYNTTTHVLNFYYTSWQAV